MARVLVFSKNGHATEKEYKHGKPIPKSALSWVHLISSEEKAVDYVLDELAQDEEFEEDILEDQRPRLSKEKSYDIIVLSGLIKKITTAKDSEDALLQLSFIIFKNRIITVADTKAGIIDSIISGFLKKGLDDVSSGALFTHIVSEFIENSIDTMEIVEKKIDRIQSNIMKGEKLNEMLSQSEMIKEAMFTSTKFTRANLEVFWEIMAGKAEFVKPEHFSEHLEDRTLYLIDLIDGSRDALNNTHNLYMTALSNKMNRHIYKLTVIGSLFFIPTMISSFWGMNVELPIHDFWIITAISFIISILFAFWLINSKME